MKVYFLDTSALVKKYHRERGNRISSTLQSNHMFPRGPFDKKYSVALGKRGQGRGIDPRPYANSFSSALASFKSAVSNPSVNQP